MGRNPKARIVLQTGSKVRIDFQATIEGDLRKSLFASIPKSQNQNGRPSSMVIKHTVIPAHIAAKAISTLHGLDLRWSGPITPTEMQYVEQYILAKYPEYSNALVQGGEKTDLYNLCIKEELSEATQDDKVPRPLRLKLQRCYDVVGESYPFFKGNFYMTIIKEEADCIKEIASYKDSKVISATETWLDLRVKGSQLSQYFRRKCKHSLKVLFSYQAVVNGTRLNIALHRPDFVLCSPANTHAHPSNITCLLVRRKSFDMTTASA
ncbi:hypothetical protein Acr_26g0006360 [Actinidia rufa]|uniref:Uncharacterized protein n=1 Tax=Actinidia rufa TaxID=165716 RepID=A0A7J0H2R0_9ERIC|nr:hypothetical protein Acr_26g0006360 [Actinidia rufa]